MEKQNNVRILMYNIKDTYMKLTDKQRRDFLIKHYNLDNSRPEYAWSDWFVGIMTLLLVIPWIGGKVFSKSPWKFDNKK